LGGQSVARMGDRARRTPCWADYGGVQLTLDNFRPVQVTTEKDRAPLEMALNFVASTED
jgi:hypothetical protein